MPIEDVNYLYAHGRKENKIIFIDSSMRDKVAYPTPAEYTFTFSEPFTNVFGIDILDAAIPRTMYNIDKYTNTLKFGVGPTAKTIDESITISSTDYTQDSLTAALSTAMENVKGKYKISVSNYGVGTSRIQFTSSVPFVLDMKNSNMCEAAGFSEYSIDNKGKEYIQIPDVHSTNPATYNHQLFGSSSEPSSTVLQLFGEFYNTTVQFTTGNYIPILSNKYVSQSFQVSGNCYLHNILVQFRPTGNYTLTEGSVTWSLVNSDASGLNQPSSLASDIVKTGTFTIDPVTWIGTTGSLTDDDFNLIYLSILQNYWIVINDTSISTDTQNCLTVLYNTTNVHADSLTTAIDGSWTALNISSSTFCINVTTITKVFYVISPGLISLIGDRFIIMRCPEVEQFIYGSVAYGLNSPGLALFKLGVVGYSDSRFDFSSAASKEFHPIGKLSKLTFRYERLSGDVYDFKGVNHHLLLVIRCLNATKPLDFTTFSLNPHYTPNYMNYLRKMEEKEGDSESEEDIDEFTYRNEYLKREDMYNYDEDDELDYIPLKSLSSEERDAWNKEIGK